MPVITINGPVGCGAIEIGQKVSQRLDINYVDRLVFAEAAKIIGSPMGALIDKEQKVTRFRDRLANLLQAMLEHEVAGNVDFGFGIETLPRVSHIIRRSSLNRHESVSRALYCQRICYSEYRQSPLFTRIRNS